MWPQRTGPTVFAARMEVLETARLQLALGPQDLASWTAHQVVLGIKPKAPRRYELARSPLSLGRYNGIDLAVLQCPENLSIGVSCIHGRSLNSDTDRHGDGIELSFYGHAFVLFAGRHLDVVRPPTRRTSRCQGGEAP